MGVGNKFGDPPNENRGDYRRWTGLNFWGRLSTYFDLTPSISFEPGASWLFNPNALDRGGVFTLPEGDTIAERQPGT